MQVWPEAAKIPAITPFTALLRSASAKISGGDLPPSSSETRAFRSAAASRDREAGRGRARERDLVDALVCDERLPGRVARPGDDVDDAGGTPASTASSASRSVEVGVISDGFTTIVLPAASAGKSFQPSSTSGEFHGVIAPTTPIGSRTV